MSMFLKAVCATTARTILNNIRIRKHFSENEQMSLLLDLAIKEARHLFQMAARQRLESEGVARPIGEHDTHIMLRIQTQEEVEDAFKRCTDWAHDRRGHWTAVMPRKDEHRTPGDQVGYIGFTLWEEAITASEGLTNIRIVVGV